jgi:murein DD-endopeptidase MepM/ murein hydrolase activator NlpD
VKLIALLTLSFLLGCQSLKIPQERLSQDQLDNSYEFREHELSVRLNNLLRCPVRVWVQAKDPGLKAYFDAINPISLPPLQDTILKLDLGIVESKVIAFASRLGDLSETVTAHKVELPFPRGKTYPLVQGYNSTPTHHTDWSRYALDFGLAIGDTVCAATPGYVVGVIEDYKYGGAGREWKNYGNFITIYDASTGLYTQYVHLQYKGSLVQLGDRVQTGQAIGIAGMTGQTNIEHLHFNCLKPANSALGLVSIPLDSIGPYKLSALKRHDLISHKN